METDLKLKKYRKGEGFRIRKQVDDYTIFNTKAARFFVINEVGHFILQQLDGKKTLDEIVELVHKECIDNPPVEAIWQDVNELVNQLLEYELIVAEN